MKLRDSAPQPDLQRCENPSPGGGDSGGCPPNDRCKDLREALERFWQSELRQDIPTPEANLGERIDRLRVRREFNRLADEYNEKCAHISGSFNKRFIIHFQGPTIPGGRLLEDFYTR